MRKDLEGGNVEIKTDAEICCWPILGMRIVLKRAELVWLRERGKRCGERDGNGGN